MSRPAFSAHDERYAELRRTGVVYAAVDEPGVVEAMRRRARADGLIATATRGPSKHLSRQQARNRTTTINLTTDGRHIVAPDSPKGL